MNGPHGFSKKKTYNVILPTLQCSQKYEVKYHISGSVQYFVLSFVCKLVRYTSQKKKKMLTKTVSIVSQSGNIAKISNIVLVWKT